MHDAKNMLHTWQGESIKIYFYLFNDHITWSHNRLIRNSNVVVALGIISICTCWFFYTYTHTE